MPIAISPNMLFEDLVKIAEQFGISFAQASSMTRVQLEKAIRDAAAGSGQGFEGGPGSAAAGTGVGASNPESQLAYQEQAYRKGVEGAGYDYDKPFGRILENRFDPIRNIFRFNAAFDRGAGRDAPNNFEAFSQANTGGGGDIYTQARNLFNRVAGGGEKLISPEGREFGQDIFSGEGQATEDSDAGRARGHLQNLARTAMFSKYGGWGLQGAPNESVEDEYNRQAFANRSAFERSGQKATQAGVNWAEILRQRFGL